MLYPSYLNLYETGELAERACAAWEILRSCTICPQNCRCNRIAGKTGVCRSGTEAIVASWNVHRREEPPISGTRGAGTIFFGYCQARCTYCQNFQRRWCLLRVCRSEEHTSELQSRLHLVCRLLLEKKKAHAKQKNRG